MKFRSGKAVTFVALAITVRVTFEVRCFKGYLMSMILKIPCVFSVFQMIYSLRYVFVTTCTATYVLELEVYVI